MGPHEPWVTIDADSGSHCLFFLNRPESEMVERRSMSNSSIVIPHRLAFLRPPALIVSHFVSFQWLANLFLNVLVVPAVP